MLFAEGVTLLPSLVLPVSQVVSAPCVVSLWRREMPTLATDGDPGGGVRKLRAPLWRAECHRSPLVRLFLLCPYPCPCCVFLGDSDAKMRGLLVLVAGTVLTFAVCHVVGAPPL